MEEEKSEGRVTRGSSRLVGRGGDRFYYLVNKGGSNRRLTRRPSLMEAVPVISDRVALYFRQEVGGGLKLSWVASRELNVLFSAKGFISFCS